MTRKKRNYIEDGIQRACAGYLEAQESYRKDFIWWHTPNGMWSNAIQGAKMKRMGMRAGVPDLIICFGNITGFVELKAEKGRMKDSQMDFMDDCERLKLPYWIIRTDNQYEACRQLEKIMNQLRAGHDAYT